MKFPRAIDEWDGSQEAGHRLARLGASWWCYRCAGSFALPVTEHCKASLSLEEAIVHALTEPELEAPADAVGARDVIRARYRELKSHGMSFTSAARQARVEWLERVLAAAGGQA